MPGSSANIDHVAVAPRGVFTIETKTYDGRLELRARGSQLWINGRNRTSLVDQANRQADVVQALLARSGTDVPTRPMLCFVRTELPLLFPPRKVGGVVICTPNNLKKRLLHRSKTRLSPDEIASITRLLDENLL